MCNQLTFGTVVGMESVVPSADMGTDLIECVDVPGLHERADCFKDIAGEWWADRDNLEECVGCDGLVDCNDIRDERCERCWNEDFIECTACSNSVERDRAYCSEGGDDYCQNCFHENFTTCEGCSCELYRDGGDVRYNNNGDAYCCGCYHDDDGVNIDETSGWKGRNTYLKIGSSRNFGVEIETSHSEDYANYTRRLGWGAKDDGSVDGKEFVSPVLYGDDGLASVEEMCEELSGSGCTVNRSCGLHVHIDINDTNEAERGRIALAYHYTREFWFGCVESHRRNNTYCRTDDDEYNGEPRYFTRDDCIEGKVKPRDRYCWVNFRAYDCHGTLEIRLHHATLDGRAICNWIKAHARFIDYAKGLTVNQITRIFAKKSHCEILRELRVALDSTDLADYYGRKVGAV